MRLGLKLAFNPRRCSLHFQLNVANPEHAEVAKKLVDMAQKVPPPPCLPCVTQPVYQYYTGCVTQAVFSVAVYQCYTGCVTQAVLHRTVFQPDCFKRTRLLPVWRLIKGWHAALPLHVWIVQLT